MPGGGTVTISTHWNQNDENQSDGAKAEAEIVIADSGPGIPPKVLPHLFQPFASRRAGGTGLGLAVTHEIIQQHSGRIEVQSEPGKGARFIFHLPLRAG
jgi:signal transduction histidine kinase